MSDDELMIAKSDVWQVTDGFDWVLSVAEWNERATGHSNTAAGAYAAMDKVMSAWALKHHGSEPDAKVLAVRPHPAAPKGFTN